MLLVVPRMPNRSKGKGQTKRSPWSSRVGFGLGANNPTLEKSNLLRNLQRTYGGGHDPQRVVAPVKKKKMGTNMFQPSGMA
jgi:hypothetical protein